MATTDRSLLDLNIKSSANDDDTLVSVVSNKASRLTLGYVKNLISQWNNLKNKPFDWNELSHTRDFSHEQDNSKTVSIYRNVYVVVTTHHPILI